MFHQKVAVGCLYLTFEGLKQNDVQGLGLKWEVFVSYL
ncbi:hypothetical protein B4135_2185 [Caldibacillus debilis]|uniref:Uncharacterized protein n=1 Tax=Caldibacillus debilis TaxID=301148 RepID=A0A150M4H4_9BACI|nr:hypothetical protein B4135_2185 [Caldibacillus debilis]